MKTEIKHTITGNGVVHARASDYLKNKKIQETLKKFKNIV